MAAKVEISEIDAVRRRLIIEVPADEVKAEFEKTYQDVSRTIRLPGFRPGRAPRHVVKQMVGDRIRADVFDRLLQQSFSEAIEREGIHAIGRPEIATDQAEEGTALRYTATVEIKPEVVAKDYDGLDVERPKVSVTDAEIEAVLERMRNAQAKLLPIDDRRIVVAGDVVDVAYEARLDGKVVGKSESRYIELGANGFPPAFDAGLIGVEVGSDVTIDVDYPETAPDARFAGKRVVFQTKLQGLMRKDVPALDDEFAKDAADSGSLEELRGQLRDRLQQNHAKDSEEVARRGLFDQLLAKNDFLVPRAMVERRTESLVEDVWEEWGRRKMRPRDETGALAQLRAEMTPRAEQQVRLGLILEAVARQESLSVSDAELDEQIAKFVEEAGDAAERARAVYADARVREQVRGSMLQSKTSELLMGRARIREIEPSHVADAAENG